MDRVPSIGLAELTIIAGIAGLVLLAAAVVVAVVLKRRRDARARTASSDGPDAPAQRPRRTWLWIVLAVLAALVIIPLCAVAGGLMLVVPVRQTVVQEPGLGPEVVVIQQGESLVTLPPAVAGPSGTPALGAQPTGATQLTSTQPGSSAVLSLNPFNPSSFVVLLGLAGLVLLLGVAVVTALGRGWEATDGPPGPGRVKEGSWGAWFRTTKMRSVLLALVLWIALSAFLILDLLFQVSLYWQFVVIYAAFWLLVGALLVSGRPLRDKLLILGLFVLVLASVRFVDWNSRKSFLRDFYSLREGMTPEQVDQTMSGYTRAVAASPSQSQDPHESGEQAEIVTGSVTYRHTNEAWGDSDWGVVTFEMGRVVRLEFLPD